MRTVMQSFIDNGHHVDLVGRFSSNVSLKGLTRLEGYDIEIGHNSKVQLLQ